MLPNILMIVCDQLRYDVLQDSCVNRAKTPNLDRLKSRGVSFNAAFSSNPLCTPARTALLTGNRPEEYGCYWNYGSCVESNTLTPNTPTYIGALKNRGYKTAYVGKWHVSPTYTPVDFGYDSYISTEDYVNFRKNAYPNLCYKNGWFGDSDPIALQDTRSIWMAQKAVEKLNILTTASTPWHLRLDFEEPHLPCRPHSKFLDLYTESVQPWGGFYDEFCNKPTAQKQQLINWNVEDFSWDDWKDYVLRYRAIVSQTDYAIGIILNYLDDHKLFDDTVVIFTADHGDMCGNHRMMDKHLVMYEDVLHVPLIVAGHDMPKGRVEEQMVCNTLDIAPTIYDLIDMPNQCIGKSFVGLLTNKKQEERNNIISYYNGQQFGLYTQRCIRTQQYKYVYNATDIDELYDLFEDKNELHNEIFNIKYSHILTSLKHQLYQSLLKEDDKMLQQNIWLKSYLLEQNNVLTDIPFNI